MPPSLGPASSSSPPHVPLGSSCSSAASSSSTWRDHQVAGLSVIVANLMGWEPRLVGPAAPSAAALLIAVFLVWTEKRAPAIRRRSSAVPSSSSRRAPILFLSFNPHRAEELKDLLVGQILWVTPGQLIPVHFIYAAVLLVWIDLTQRRALFYIVFAVRSPPPRSSSSSPRLRLADHTGARRARPGAESTPAAHRLPHRVHPLRDDLVGAVRFPDRPAIVCALALVAGTGGAHARQGVGGATGSEQARTGSPAAPFAGRR